MSDADANVVRLQRFGSGFACADEQALFDFMQEWLDEMRTGAQGKIRTICLVVERNDATQFHVTQAIAGVGKQDVVRTAGLLTREIHNMLADVACEYAPREVS